MNRIPGPMNQIFDGGGHGADAGEGLDLHAGQAATDDTATVRTGLDDRPQAWQPIGSQFSIRPQVVTRPPVNRGAAKACQRRHPHGQRPTLRAALHGGHKRRLVGLTTPALVAPALTRHRFVPTRSAACCHRARAWPAEPLGSTAERCCRTPGDSATAATASPTARTYSV